MRRFLECLGMTVCILSLSFATRDLYALKHSGDLILLTTKIRFLPSRGGTRPPREGIKFMKKRLLITSIVMMLVVAVALSTATYAWFTSASSVSASSVTLTAATNDAAALGISWTTGNYGTSISGSFDGGTLAPMAPTAYTVGTTTISSGVNQIAFNTATIKSDPTNGLIFGAAGAPATPYTWTDGLAQNPHYSFHVKNLAPAGTTNVTVTITAAITGAAADLTRVAIFKDDELLGVIANDKAADTRADVAVGTIQNGGIVASFPTVSAANTLSYTLNADTDSEIAVIMWLDGALFDETRSTETASVALSFGGTKITNP